MCWGRRSFKLHAVLTKFVVDARDDEGGSGKGDVGDDHRRVAGRGGGGGSTARGILFVWRTATSSSGPRPLRLDRQIFVWGRQIFRLPPFSFAFPIAGLPDPVGAAEDLSAVVCSLSKKSAI